jgi:DNA-binding transcriptional LysR family regulator
MSGNWDNIDVHLLKVLLTLLTESNVSRTARKLNVSQPAVSTALKRLRELTGDPLLVRSKGGMTPTERGRALIEPVRLALEQIDAIAQGNDSPHFNPEKCKRSFSIGTPDYFNVHLAADLIKRVQFGAPEAQVTMHSMGPDMDYPRALETGDIDVVIGNWPQLPEHLRAAPLFEDRMVVMMRADHQLAGKPINAYDYLAADHLAPTPYSVGQRGVVDVYLARERIKRKVRAYVPYFNMAPYLLINSDLLFTAPSRFAAHYAAILPISIHPSPLDYSKMTYYLLWHDRQQYSAEARWFREQIVQAARATCGEGVS